MEVHHHTHTGRKKFTHYLWEFLMLFLAVFCGFLAENQREHFIEHRREKEYISSLVRDVQKDTANISTWLSEYEKLRKNCDSVINNFEDARNFSDQWSRNFFTILRGFPDFIYTDQTMQQLKNAGSLRVIRNKQVIDSIAAYDAAVRDILIEETVNDGYYSQISDFTNNHLIYRRVVTLEKGKGDDKEGNYWMNYNDDEMERLYNLVYQYGYEITDFITYLGDLKHRGARLVGLLTSEYDLK